MRISRSVRTIVVTVALASLLLGAIPAQSFAAVSIQYDLSWGSEGLLDGQFYYPPDVTTDKWGNVYVAGGESGDNRIQMFTADGVFVRSVGTTDTPNTGTVRNPRSVATDRWGAIYVAEKEIGPATIRVFNSQLYSESGTFQESAADEIKNPTAIAAGLDGTVYLVDEANKIQRWRNRSYIGYWSVLGQGTMGLGVTQDDRILTTTDITSGITESVIEYAPTSGALVRSWGGHGTAAGQFLRPYDVSADPVGNSYVVESSGGRGQVFAPDGTYVATFGSSGSGPGQFSGPYGVVAGYDRTVYVADPFLHRISKWNVTVATEATQVAGDTRYTTAVEASKRAYPNGAKTVVIATAANWPDALGGAALAGTVKGPLLLTAKDSLPTAVRDEIIRLGALDAYVLGSEDAVSKTVFDAVDDLMILKEPTRLGGSDRYSTANLIASETVRLKNLGDGYDGTAFVATGMNFPDALAASPIAAANGWPIYLTQPNALPASVKTAMTANGSNHGYILGSTDAVSAAVATTLNTAPFIGFGRYGGINRYETAAKVATIGYDGMGMLWSRPALAVGTNFPDALAGGVLQGSDYSVLLLTPKDSLDPYAAAALTENRDMIYELRFLGSTSALGTVPRNAAMSLLH
jgi:putative cell wall-binding protein